MSTPDMDAAVEQLRIAIGVALVQSGKGDDCDLVDAHPCPDCPDKGACACSGVPYLTDLVWNKIDAFGDFAKAVELLTAQARADERAKVLAVLADAELAHTSGPDVLPASEVFALCRDALIALVRTDQGGES